MNPYYQSGGITLHHGDCLDVMAELEPNSVEAVVTDPPYGLSKEPDIRAVLKHWLDGDDYEHGSSGFMGKTWDSFVPGPVIWKECHRVLKPGGYLLCFASTRTFDLMAIALRLAGFDQHPFLAWIFGSGFPKAANLSKAIDKAAGVEREVVGPNLNARHGRVGCSTYQRGNDACENPDITAPSTDAAKQWDGWYYGKQSLKPAMEPILMFQKPPEGRMVDNVQKWGCGGLNIDGSRVGTDENLVRPAVQRFDNQAYGKGLGAGVQDEPTGRFPANLILSYPEDEYDADGNLLPNPGKDEVLAGFPQTSSARIGNPNNPKRGKNHTATSYGQGNDAVTHDFRDSGSAARFFYTAKASKSDRGGGLDGSEIVYILFAWENEVQKVRLQVATGRSRPRVTAVSGAHEQDPRVWSKWLFGNDTTDSSLKGCRFITSTTTNSTTRSTTWNFLTRCLTRDCTADVLSETGLSSSPAESAGTLTLLTSITSAGMESLLGVAPVASRTLLQISASEGNCSESSPGRFCNFHATVKPIDLMRYLIRLVCPPGGTVLDPFNGSGATTYAAREEGCKAIGIELSEEYCAIAKSRLKQGVLDFS